MDTTAPPIGLSEREAAARLERDGPNVLPRAGHPSFVRRLVGEFVHFFALMLWAAGVLAFVAGMPQLGVAIFVVVIVNGLFAFAQQQRAERASERLQAMIPDAVTVRRDGVEVVVGAAQVVVGDAVVVSSGDRVPADLRIVEAEGLSLDESMLTGESVPVAAGALDPAWAGTFVVNGNAVGECVAIGGDTRLAGIARLTETVHPPTTPLAAELDRIVRTIAMIAVGVGVAFFVITLLVGTGARNGFLFAVGVTVALVPEGLLPTVTLSLAMGAQNMARHHALVRNLEAVETLGSVTFICTDKTGTLTHNRMSVTTVWTPFGSVTIEGEGYRPDGVVIGDAVEPARAVARSARLASRGRAVERDGEWTAKGDPMEAAIDALAHRIEGTDDTPNTFHAPFDPDRRRESVIVGEWLYVKGAPDSVIPLTTDPVAAAAATEAVATMAAGGLRCLAVARRPAAAVAPVLAHAAESDEPANPADLEHELELLGVMGLEDPPRAEVADALVACRRAGIGVAMLTGDHPATAEAIARRIGLLGPGGLVVEGPDLPDDPAVLGALLDRDGVVVSRVTPADKLRIARALQQRGHVLAMTGDGVNDGPALRTADIGVAMGRSGTDVAREAADLVLLDDNFATIVAAIAQGRGTFANIHRFLTYHLTDNVAELTPFVVWALSGGRFPLALGVLQILCLDIGTDLLPALALGAEATGADVLDRPPERRHLIDPSLVRRVFGVLGPAEAAVEMAAFLTVFLVAGWRPGDAFPGGQVLLQASGAAFTAVVLGQAANAVACRSARKPAWRVGWFGNKLLTASIGFELVVLAGFLGIPPVADLLDHAAPTLAGLGVAALAIPAVWSADATHKWFRARRRHPSPVR